MMVEQLEQTKVYTQEQLDLLAHIQAKNAETQAWIDAGPDRWAGFIADDLDYWAEMGITSVAEYERDSLISFISDASKDAYGFRMRYDYNSMSMDELEALADDISKAAQATIDDEERERQDAAARFEAKVNETIAMGAGNRATAIRWLMDGLEGYDGCDDRFRAEGFCYEWNLPYRMVNELVECLKEAA